MISLPFKVGQIVALKGPIRYFVGKYYYDGNFSGDGKFKITKIEGWRIHLLTIDTTVLKLEGPFFVAEPDLWDMLKPINNPE